MLIQGKHGEYEVTAKSFGWSYCQAVVKVKAKFLGFIPYYKTVWTTSSTPFDKYPMMLVEAKRMHKEPMTKWFEHAVKQYEEHKESWEN